MPSYNWFYDWSVITKNDSRVDVEVRQYASLSIPVTIPWKRYSSLAVPMFGVPTGSIEKGHWTFMVQSPSASIIPDVSGNGGILNNFNTGALWVSRRCLMPILGGGSAGYNVTGSASATANVAFGGSFSWETYIYGIDATNTASNLLISRTGSVNQGWSINWDFTNQLLSFVVGTGASSYGIVNASLAPYQTECGFPANYHHFAGAYLSGSALALYIDGVQVGFSTYTGSVTAPSSSLLIKNGQSLWIDEFVMYNSYADANYIGNSYYQTKERLNFLGVPSGSAYKYHQARFTVYASGSNEFELHSFSLRGLQNISASVFDPDTSDLYVLPVFSSASGSTFQSIGGILY